MVLDLVKLSTECVFHKDAVIDDSMNIISNCGPSWHSGTSSCASELAMCTQAWSLQVDVLVLDHHGNLHDAATQAVWVTLSSERFRCH